LTGSKREGWEEKAMYVFLQIWGEIKGIQYWQCSKFLISVWEKFLVWYLRRSCTERCLRHENNSTYFREVCIATFLWLENCPLIYRQNKSIWWASRICLKWRVYHQDFLYHHLRNFYR
jgi:hypothetical protein